MRRAAIAAVALLIVAGVGLLVGSLERAHAPTRPGPRQLTGRAAAPPSGEPGTEAAPPNTTLLASVHRVIARFDAPGGAQVGSVAPTWDGAAVTVPVIARRADWLEVRLPERPNELTAWIRAGDVTLSYTPYRIVIDEARTHLLLEYEGRVIDDFPAGIGTPTDPTPTGDFFVAYFAEPPSPGYGPFVIATSAHSNAITDWDESGDAEIAIHGPLGADAAIGSSGARISHGCVRLHVADLLQLRDVPVGTPVDIVAS